MTCDGIHELYLHECNNAHGLNLTITRKKLCGKEDAQVLNLHKEPKLSMKDKGEGYISFVGIMCKWMHALCARWCKSIVIKSQGRKL